MTYSGRTATSATPATAMPGRGVELGGLGRRGEHEGGRHHRAAEDEHAERGREVDAAQPREHAGQRCRPP